MIEQKYECLHCRQVFFFAALPNGLTCPSCGGPLIHK